MDFFTLPCNLRHGLKLRLAPSRLSAIGIGPSQVMKSQQSHDGQVRPARDWHELVWGCMDWYEIGTEQVTLLT